MFIDTHMHIGDSFGISPDLYIEHATNSNVMFLIASFCEKDDLKDVEKYLNKYESLYAAIGYHPEVSNRIVENDYLVLKNMIKNNSKIVAIGEIGLDYHYDKENKEKQKEVFKRQLKLASELDLPVVIHSRDATGDTYDTLKEYKVRGVIHCFSGSLEMAKKYIDLGFKIGIGGVVTFKNSKLYQVIENISLNDIVLETDSPYLSPEPKRGQVNESSNLIYIAQKIADIKNISLDEVCGITTDNALKLFDLHHKM